MAQSAYLHGHQLTDWPDALMHGARFRSHNLWRLHKRAQILYAGVIQPRYFCVGHHARPVIAASVCTFSFITSQNSHTMMPFQWLKCMHTCRTGKLSQEEKARRLAEMQGNAEVHDDARWKRMSDEKKKDAAEAVELANQSTGSAAAFLKQAHKTVYGATGEGATLEDRIGRRKYYNDKDTERGAFKR